VRVLERAGLVRRKVEGRAHVCQIVPHPLKAATDWLARYERYWTTRLDALEAFLKEEDAAASKRNAR
jgi:hypothetical protein